MRLSHVTLGKLLNISVLRFPHLANCDNSPQGWSGLKEGSFPWTAFLPPAPSTG